MLLQRVPQAFSILHRVLLLLLRPSTFSQDQDMLVKTQVISCLLPYVLLRISRKDEPFLEVPHQPMNDRFNLTS